MIEKILKLSKKIKFSPYPDPASLEKLVKEWREFEEKLDEADLYGSALELADLGYYCLKILFLAVCKFNYVFGKNIIVKTVFQFTIAKYSLRAMDGNPKNDKAEREKIKEILKWF